LAAVAAANEAFKRMPNAEVDLAIVSRSLSHAKWAREILQSQDFFMSRASAMACISMFESKDINLRPENLEDLLAVSSSNHLYATEILFCDPSEKPPANALRHVIESVGRSGLALLLSPRSTILREMDRDSWVMVNHVPFDGRYEDSFASTSLHLSLTGNEQTVNIHEYGDIDSSVDFVEAVVSAHDRGVWHAGLDLLHLATRKWSRDVHANCQRTEM